MKFLRLFTRYNFQSGLAINECVDEAKSNEQRLPSANSNLLVAQKKPSATKVDRPLRIIVALRDMYSNYYCINFKVVYKTNELIFTIDLSNYV